MGLAVSACVGDEAAVTGGQDGGADVGSDAVATPSEAGTTEAGDSGSSQDSALAPDAPDANVPATWCTGRPEKFCWDFDRGVFDDGWTRRESLGTITQSSDASSPPTSMLATLLPGTPTAGTPIDADLIRGITGTPTATHFAADIKPVATADAGADAGAMSIVVAVTVIVSASSFAALGWDDKTMVLQMTNSNGTQVFTFATPPTPNVWTRVSLDVTWSSNGQGAALVAMGGTTVFSKAAFSTLDATPTSLADLIIGLQATGPEASQLAAEFDNVTLDY
jgi:hypothetical protein